MVLRRPARIPPEISQRALSTAEIKAIHDQGPAVSCAPTSSSLTLQTPATAIPGSQNPVVGEPHGRRRAFLGASIEFSRSANGGAPAAFATVATAADGSYTYDDTPSLGTTTYRAAYAGDVGIAAESAWSTVVETRSRRKELRFAASKNTVNYGESVTVTAHLKSGSPNRTVSIYATAARGIQEALEARPCERFGEPVRQDAACEEHGLHRDIHGRRLVEERRGWTEKEVKVVPRWAGRATGGYATDHGVRLYHYSTTCTSRARGHVPQRRSRSVRTTGDTVSSTSPATAEVADALRTPAPPV